MMPMKLFCIWRRFSGAIAMTDFLTKTTHLLGSSLMSTLKILIYIWYSSYV